MTTKAQLQLEAKTLGLSTAGTVGDLERRVANHKASIARQQAQTQADADDQTIWDEVQGEIYDAEPATPRPRDTAAGPFMLAGALLSGIFTK